MTAELAVSVLLALAVGLVVIVLVTVLVTHVAYDTVQWCRERDARKAAKATASDEVTP